MRKAGNVSTLNPSNISFPYYSFIYITGLPLRIIGIDFFTKAHKDIIRAKEQYKYKHNLTL